MWVQQPETALAAFAIGCCPTRRLVPEQRERVRDAREAGLGLRREPPAAAAAGKRDAHMIPDKLI